MYQFEEIKTVHLEISTLCNAKCPMCLRNISGGKTNPLLPLAELRMGEVEKIFTEPFLQRLERIYLCGSYGDPATGKDTVSALSYFRATNKNIRLEIFSNGSLRNQDWWSALAKLNVEAYFGIDGLAGTNHLYRRNTDFKKIMENATAFIESGGKAHWDFIAFRHNEHEIPAARTLSEKMGFSSFRIKKTGRFFSHSKNSINDKHAVLSDTGELEYYLEQPIQAQLQNQSLLKEGQLIQKYGSMENYFNQTEIECKAALETSLYITAEGLVFPCCWTAIQLYPWYQAPESSQIWDCIRESPLGIDSINALKRPLKDIVAGEFFQKIIPSKWALPSIKEGRLKYCARICGKGFSPFNDQFNATTEPATQ